MTMIYLVLLIEKKIDEISYENIIKVCEMFFRLIHQKSSADIISNLNNFHPAQ